MLVHCCRCRLLLLLLHHLVLLLLLLRHVQLHPNKILQHPLSIPHRRDVQGVPKGGPVLAVVEKCDCHCLGWCGSHSLPQPCNLSTVCIRTLQDSSHSQHNSHTPAHTLLSAMHNHTQ